MKLSIGDRVETPEGPGTVVGTREWANNSVATSVSVETEASSSTCWSSRTEGRTFASGAPTSSRSTFSSKAENQAEALEVERHQEEKHGEP